jgi:hypothetical protein
VDGRPAVWVNLAAPRPPCGASAWWNKIAATSAPRQGQPGATAPPARRLLAHLGKAVTTMNGARMAIFR